MAGHGGARPGAGAPRGGISHTRRLLLRGIKGGFVMVGREKGITGTDDEVAVETIAHAAADLLRAGQVREVLAIYAQSASKGEEGDGEDLSPFQMALKRLPGMQNGADVPRMPGTTEENRENKPINDKRPTDPALVTRPVQPFFSPQQTLLITPPAAVCPADDRPPERSARVLPGHAGRADPLPDPPTPHPEAPPPPIPLETENFEKNFPVDDGLEPR